MSYFPTSVPTLLQLLQAKNNIAVTLDGGINDIITTIPVLDTSDIPISGYITFQDGTNECIYYSGVTPTSLTGCTRGADGTTAANHADTTAIGMWWNAEYHNRLTEELRGISQNLSDRIGLHGTRVVLQDYLDANSKKISGLAAGTVNGDALRYEQLVGVYLPLGGGTMTGSIAFGGTYKLTGLAAGSVNGDSLRYEQLVGVYLPLAGGTMAGSIAFGGTYKLTGLAAGSTNGDSVRYEQVVGVYLPLAGGTMAGSIAMGGTYKLTGLAAGTTNGDSLRYEQLVGVYLPLAGGTLTGDLVMDNQTGIQFRELTGGGTNYIKLIAPDAVASNLTLKLPAADGISGHAIKTDGLGNLAFGPVAGDVTLYRESYIVGTASGNYTGSLTVFDMTGLYTTGNNSMMVLVDGVMQRLGASFDYVETDTNTVTFNAGLIAGQTVSLMWAVPAPVGDTTTNREDYIVGTASGSYTGSTTVFDLTQTYQVAAKTLQVFYDGVLQKLGASYDYVETDNDTVTFNTALTSTHAVSFLYTVPVSNSGIVSNGAGNQMAQYAVGGSTVTGSSVALVSNDGIVLKPTTANADSMDIQGQTSGTVAVRMAPLGASSNSAKIIGTLNGADTNMDLRVGGVDMVKITPTSTSIKGTNTNDNATAGYVGEHLVNRFSAATPAATDTYGNNGFLTLTAGDWDVTGVCQVDAPMTTVTRFLLAVSIYSGNTTTDHVAGDNVMDGFLPTSSYNGSASVPSYRISVASTATVYIKPRLTYTGSPKVTGRISARRVR